MALIKCPECGESISSDVYSCPKCGKKIRKQKRSFLGKIIKWAFILFNILMIACLYSGMHAATTQVHTATSEAAKAGAAIGTGIGGALLLGIWMAGDIILGFLVLFTRPK